MVDVSHLRLHVIQRQVDLDECVHRQQRRRDGLLPQDAITRRHALQQYVGVTSAAFLRSCILMMMMMMMMIMMMMMMMMMMMQERITSYMWMCALFSLQ